MLGEYSGIIAQLCNIDEKSGQKNSYFKILFFRK
jgi:hypothetical protein